MIVSVFHVSPRDDGSAVDQVKVAEVRVDAPMPVEAALEVAYCRTQNLEGSWSRGVALDDGSLNSDWSPTVTVCQPLHVRDGRTYGLRSSMTGDVLQLEDGRRFRVAMCGFDAIAPSEAPAA